MRADLAAELLIMLGIVLLTLAAGIWLGPAAALTVAGLSVLACGVIIARGGIRR